MRKSSSLPLPHDCARGHNRDSLYIGRKYWTPTGRQTDRKYYVPRKLAKIAQRSKGSLRKTRHGSLHGGDCSYYSVAIIRSAKISCPTRIVGRVDWLTDRDFLRSLTFSPTAPEILYLTSNWNVRLVRRTRREMAAIGAFPSQSRPWSRKSSFVHAISL